VRADADAAGGASVAIVYPAIRPLGRTTPAPVDTDLTFDTPVARYAPDAIYLATPAEPTRLALHDVRGYAVTRPGRGALEGAVIGTVAGALAGVLIGFAQGSDPPPPTTCSDYDGGMICTTIGGNGLSAREKATAFGVGLGLTGGGIGALIGWKIGHTDRFVF